MLSSAFGKEAEEDRHLALMNALFCALSFLSLSEPLTRCCHWSNIIPLLYLAHEILVFLSICFEWHDFPLLIDPAHLFFYLSPHTDLVCFKRQGPHN